MIAIVMIPGVLCEGYVTPYTLMKCVCVCVCVFSSSLPLGNFSPVLYF